LAGAVAAERTADLIMAAARSLEADYIVAGAYGHSRFREAVFGGVTRDLLKKSEVPLLLAH
jgi:nucleotide-binding universal stress UspA family protein